MLRPNRYLWLGTHKRYAAFTFVFEKTAHGWFQAHIYQFAVGAISQADHANSILAAGRADLCAVARPHLANPAWTLTEAAKIGYTPIDWPRQYHSAKAQIETQFTRERAAAGTKPA